MIKANLIIGGTKEKRLKIVKKLLKEKTGITNLKSHPDLLIIQGAESIGIEEIRKLKRKLILKPYSATLKVAIFPEAEKLTIPAQNALLKTLEEPPEKSLLILCSPLIKLLLPTIISRCYLIKLPLESEVEISEKNLSFYKNFLGSLGKKSVGERLKLAEQFSKNKDSASKFCLEVLVFGRKMMLEKPSLRLAKNLRLIQTAHFFLESNVNPNLTLGNLFLSLS